jgi:hypothetical protein
MLNLIPEHSRNAIKAWGGIKNRRSIWVTDELASMLLLSGIIISLANYNNQHIDFLLHVAKEDQFTKKLIDHKDDIL